MIYKLQHKPAFGFQSRGIHATAYRDDKREELKPPHSIQNFFNLTGYIPIIGSFVGVNRIISMSSKACLLPKSQKIKYIVRGLIETFSLGVIILPFDLVVTVARKIDKTFLEIKKKRSHAG